jgi:UDP-2,3-diacylglucosamine pyrophosphatase LpxH
VDEAWIISDLHLGAGDWPGLEDFRDDGLLVEWLGRDEKRDGTVVVNGDFIDFLQIPSERPDPGLSQWVLWDEATSVDKLHRCFEAHAAVFDALRDFNLGGGTLLFTIGNHDLDLGWSKVKDELRVRVGDTNGAIPIELEHTVFERVHVEHGHRFTGENRPKVFDQFIHRIERDGQEPLEVLECVWGSRFVLDALNPLEIEHPFIDNVKPTWKLAVHMLRDSEWLAGRRARTLLDMIRFFRRTGIPWRDIAGALLEEEDASLAPETLERAFAEEEDEWRALVRELRSQVPDEFDKRSLNSATKSRQSSRPQPRSSSVSRSTSTAARPREVTRPTSAWSGNAGSSGAPVSAWRGTASPRSCSAIRTTSWTAGRMCCGTLVRGSSTSTPHRRRCARSGGRCRGVISSETSVSSRPSPSPSTSDSMAIRPPCHWRT